MARQPPGFSAKSLRRIITQAPRVITVDKNTAYPVEIEALREDETLNAETELRQSKYLKNVIEQDHRNAKRIVKLTSSKLSTLPFVGLLFDILDRHRRRKQTSLKPSCSITR